MPFRGTKVRQSSDFVMDPKLGASTEGVAVTEGALGKTVGNKKAKRSRGCFPVQFLATSSSMIFKVK